jgi:hypothetical protein
MIQHTFPVTTYRPRVVITNINGRLTVQPWARQAIYLETWGEIGTITQEDETFVITDCQHDLVLRVPSITELAFTVITDITITNLQHSATISNAGNVILTNINGDVLLQDIHGDVQLINVHGAASLTHIGGNLHAEHLPQLDTRYIGGNTILADVAQVNLSAVGGNLTVTGADSVICGAVGSDLEVEYIGHDLQCNTVGGHCTVRNCAGATISIHTIGEDLTCADATPVGSCVIGGDLHLQPDFSPCNRLFYHVGGNAHIVLPENANLALSMTVGGNATGPTSTYVRNGGFVNLLCGAGSAQFDLTVDGDVILSGAEPCRSRSEFSWDEFGQSLAFVY